MVDSFIDSTSTSNNTSTRTIKGSIDIIVLRIDRKGRLGNSRPCKNCIENLKRLNVDNVYYSVKGGDVICEKFVQLAKCDNLYISRGDR